MKKIFLASILIMLSAFMLYGQASEFNHSYANKYTRYRNPVAAGALSLLFPGAGQIYNKQPVKAVVFMGAYIVGAGIYIHGLSEMMDDMIPAIATVTTLGLYPYQDDGNDGSSALTLGSIVLISDCLISVIDAAVSASAINKRYNLSVKFMDNDFMNAALKDRIVPLLAVKIRI